MQGTMDRLRNDCTELLEIQISLISSENPITWEKVREKLESMKMVLNKSYVLFKEFLVLYDEFNRNILALLPLPFTAVYKLYQSLSLMFVSYLDNLVLILMIAALMVFLKRSIINSIVLLSKLMKKVKSGNMDVQSPLQCSDEIGVLSDSFKSMVGELKNLIARIKVDEQTKRNWSSKSSRPRSNPTFCTTRSIPSR